MMHLHHQHRNLLEPLEDIVIQLAILFRVLGIIEPLATEFLFDSVKP